MLIKEAEKKDFDELNLFFIRMNEIINTRNNGFNPDNAVYPSENMILKAIEDREQIIGIEDGKIVAACIVNNECEDAYKSAKWNVPAEKHELWVLHALRVAPEYEGRGFAKQMLAFVIGLAAKRGKKTIRLDVLEGYWVEHIYRLFDFKYVETVEMLYEDIGYPRRFKLFERKI